jgi:hypothetical protein
MPCRAFSATREIAFTNVFLVVYFFIPMQRRRSPSSKPNKRFDSEVTLDQLKALRRRVSYGGNAEHKRNPGDFGLSPPFGPRKGKTLCDGVSIFQRAVALRLLRGASNGDW